MTQQQARTNQGSGSNCILIVEDDTAIGELLTLALTYETPYEPLLVTSGQEALRVAEAVHPLLLLLNYQLPDMTGLEVYDRLHERTEFSATPAIVLSANVPKHELKKRQLVEVKKPFDMDDLLETIEQAVSSSSK